jgi:hypothetical protein
MRIKNSAPYTTSVLGLLLAGSLFTDLTAGDADAFLGRWALTIPGGGAGWIGVTKENGYFDASVLWGGGSVVPVDNVFFEGNAMLVTRSREVKRKDASGKVVCTQRLTELLTGTVDGDRISFKRTQPNENGEGLSVEEFSGKRIPALPPKPDLSQVKYGDAIPLFNGKSTDGWKLTDANAVSGWRVEDGILINRPDQEKDKPHKNYGNLRTEREFEDFNLQVELRVNKDGNSGIYLRGIYEVQVMESYGRSLDNHHMGAVYSRIQPLVSAERPPGEWQTLDITLIDRHVTVILNDKKIIDNQPLQGCTGGALTSDEFKPGPIYLQGDHTAVDYRKLVLRPVMKR